MNTLNHHAVSRIDPESSFAMIQVSGFTDQQPEEALRAIKAQLSTRTVNPRTFEKA